ncbi:hypothetical protein BDZ94DRAFT_1308861 [Collybia nuda]|uniref:ATPase inhibitor, mitochondrial n=1 Tax=Collybia nuda TaxID=64659 RepID=A0A9P6CJZ5_9AGAR|nr:hypothetical protein BDZ94DRAFT_1308861 [Collybia nuda]
MLARITAVRRVPQLVFVPMRLKSSQVEGSVAQSKGFSEKERAHENEYARRHEIELLQKMRENIEKKKLELERLEKEREELEKNHKN